MSGSSKPWQEQLKCGTLVTFVGDEELLAFVQGDRDIKSDVVCEVRDYFESCIEDNEARDRGKKYLVKKAQVELTFENDAHDGPILRVYDKANKETIHESISLGERPFELSELPGCCGVDVVHDFDNHVDAFMLNFAAHDPECDDKPGALVATTIESQESAVDALKKAGFKPVAEFMGHTGNEITLWVKVISKENE